MSGLRCRYCPVVSVLALGFMASAWAYEISTIRVSHEQHRYQIHMDVIIDADAHTVHQLFSDVRQLPEINSAVVQVKVLGPDTAQRKRVQTQVRGCVSFFCRTLDQVQDMRFTTYTHDRGGAVSASVIPALSDFRYGQAAWLFTSCAGKTCLRFDAALEPDFWVPPLIGPWLIQRKMREEARQTSAGLEALAQKHQAGQ